ncbi:MAG: hypothetical protein KAT16_02055 [Candidatus Heimdallarchaeota archaeon]|nr:hypothetical protein [Candidatus Heimdallarchaeota archaeon]
MTEPLLKAILEGINELKIRMKHLEWLILESRFSDDNPIPEELAIINEYEKEKLNGRVKFSKFV